MVTDLNVRQMTEIIRRTRKRGVIVREMPGWERRGRGWLFTPGAMGDLAILDHEDASTVKAGEWGSLGWILDGSPIAPLSQWQVARCRDNIPKVAAVAAGGCNHAGAGGPLRGVPRDLANKACYGIEKANDNRGELHTEAALYANTALQLSILEVV